MAWFAQNWFWVLLLIGFIAMHLGHGGGCGHGGHKHQHQNDQNSNVKKPSSDEPQH